MTVAPHATQAPIQLSLPQSISKQSRGAVWAIQATSTSCAAEKAETAPHGHVDASFRFQSSRRTFLYRAHCALKASICSRKLSDSLLRFCVARGSRSRARPQNSCFAQRTSAQTSECVLSPARSSVLRGSVVVCFVPQSVAFFYHFSSSQR
jgi:hypothetical protein